jgi:hypothetical protein
MHLRTTVVGIAQRSSDILEMFAPFEICHVSMLTIPERMVDLSLRSDHIMPTIDDKTYKYTHLWITNDSIMNDHCIMEAEVVQIFALHRSVYLRDSE